MQSVIEYCTNHVVENRQLNALFAASWEGWIERDFGPVLGRSLGHVIAVDEQRLIGFINVAWDGGCHAFLLDTTVHPEYQRQGVGTGLVEQAVQIARKAGVEWVHVDFEQTLSAFYLGSCGFASTAAGLIRLTLEEGSSTCHR